MRVTEQLIAEKLEAHAQAADGAREYAEMPLRPDAQLKDAAVLIPLFFADDDWHVLYTRRTERVESHKGQVSFPGGAADDGETSAEQTALREANEEIGMSPQLVRVLGQLAPLITISSFRVRPVVGVIPWPYAFKVAAVEVARVFTIPLSWLAERNNYWEFSMRDSQRSLIAYHPFDGELLWGATARMTVSFLHAIDLLK